MDAPGAVRADLLVESGQGPFDDGVKRRDFCRLLFWSKAAKALSTAASKGVTLSPALLVESDQGPDDGVKRR
jgi:hypothetical protein